jgi:hypothetical protein
MSEKHQIRFTDEEFLKYWDGVASDDHPNWQLEEIYVEEFGSGRVSLGARYNDLPERIKDLLPAVPNLVPEVTEEDYFTIGSVKEHAPPIFYVTW